MKAGIPQFLVPQRARWRSCLEALVALWWSESLRLGLATRAPEYFSKPGLPWPNFRRRAFLSSSVLHASAILVALHGPFSLFTPNSPPQEARPELVYELKSLNLSKYLPSLRARGPGGRPGRGSRPNRPPARGSTAFDAKLTLVSNPPRPDNFRQTIIQSSSPPELKISVDLRLPNIVVGSPMMARKQPVEFRLDVQVRATSRQTSPAVSPVPDVSARPTDLAIAPSPALNPLPRLAVAPAPSLALSGAGARVDTAGIADAASREWAEGDPGGLLVLGVDPAPYSGSLALPPGNRYGAFSISPFGGQPGSPGGIPGGDPESGTGGAGTGGDGSTGVGSGGSGGGGSNSGTLGSLTLSGGSSGGSGVGGSDMALPASLPTTLVYPVKAPPRPRMGALTVTTGPIGGGGLRVYGVLRGGKVYTIYLPMPGKSWVLQYVDRSRPREETHRSYGPVARLDHGLVPPWAEEQYDFRRPPVPKDKEDEFIVLRGMLREDGTVADLKVFQGIAPLADQAALAAFRRWKFKPALRDSKPVPVEILVGVPAHILRENR